MASASLIIGYTLAAYSAVSAVKALKTGNILGAVMAGFGAYAGLNMAGAFNTAVAGDALATSAAAEGGGFASNFAAASGDGATGALFDGVGTAAEFTTPALTGSSGILNGASAPMIGGGINNTLGTVTPTLGGEAIGGFGDTFSGLIDSVKQGAIDLGNSVQGSLQSVGDGTFLDSAGQLFDEAGNLLKNNSGLVSMAGSALQYKGQKDAIKAQTKSAEEGRRLAQEEGARKRKSIGGASDYVYDFGLKNKGVL